MYVITDDVSGEIDTKLMKTVICFYYLHSESARQLVNEAQIRSDSE